MKRILAIFILGCFLINSIGYFYIFTIHKYLLQKELTRSLGEGRVRITILKILSPERNKHFVRIHSKEFRYNGKMFDIIFESKKANTTTFYCVQDSKEDHLIARFNKETQRRITDFMQDHMIKIALVHKTVDGSIVGCSSWDFGEFHISYPGYIPGTNSPPPKS